MAFFNDIHRLPEDPIFSIPPAFAADPRTNKINLSIGTYKTSEGLPFVLTTVREAESLILQERLFKDYLPIEGDAKFIQCALKLLFGMQSAFLQRGHYFAAQTVGGANALRVIGEFLAKHISKTIFIPQPTWSNHKQVFECAGFKVGSYPYFNYENCQLDFNGMCLAIKNMPSRSIILLHSCCHNPTGIDPTLEQWKEFASLIKEKKILPLFDVAYQGFGKNLDEDVEVIRHFVEEEHEMAIAYSFSKNFGLYGERVGFLTITTHKEENVPKIASQIKYLIRSNYSNPPLHGARIISTILNSSDLTMQWKKELYNMHERISEMRKALIATLLVLGNGHDFSYLYQQNGLFAFLGLTPNQVRRLRDEKGLYIPCNGRINIAGLNMKNLPYVSEALLSVM